MLRYSALAASLALAIMSSSGMAADVAPAALIIAQGGLGDGSWNDTANAGFKAGLEKTGIKGRPIESKGRRGTRRRDHATGSRWRVRSGNKPEVDSRRTYGETGGRLSRRQLGDHESDPQRRQYRFGCIWRARGVLSGWRACCPGDDGYVDQKGINEQAVIGVIGGVKAPGIDKFIVGYIQGAKAINPDVDVKVAYSESFGDPAKGQQMAKAMFNEGADIVYQVAGGTGIGIIEAAKAEGRYAIGVDTDQDGMAPGNVLTSMIKRVDVAVEDIMINYAAGKFPGGEVMDFGLAQNGVALSDMKHTKDMVPAAYLEKVDALKADIVAGKIDVWDVSTEGYPDFFR